MHSPIGRMFRECSVIEEQRKTTKDFSCPSSALPRQTVAAKMPCTVRLPRWATARYVSYLYWPLVLALVLLVNCILCFELSAEDACKDFVGDDPSLGWRLDECIAVWKAWASTVPLTESPAIHESLRRVAGDLQRAGSTCFLKGEISMDGAGSSAMRSIMTLLLAEDLGCKWVSPEWGRPVMGKNGAVLYCHEKLGKGHNKIDILAEKEKYNAVCSVIDWMEYFRFAQESVSLPESGTAKVVQV